MSDKTAKTESLFTITRRNAAPLVLSSSVDLIAWYEKEILARAPKQEWWRPLVLKDEKGENVAAFDCSTITSIIQGAPADGVPGMMPPTTQGRVG